MGTKGRDGTNSGAFVVLVGPDGVGKTSVARALLDIHGGPGGYVHFRPSPFSDLAPGPGESEFQTLQKSRLSGSRSIGWLRAVVSLLIFWAGYLAKVRPAVRSGSLVVGDRWGYGYFAQPDALRFYGPHWLGKALVRLIPRPDVLVNLIAPADAIEKRKNELSREEIESELRLWASLPVKGRVDVEAGPDPQSVARKIYELACR